MIKSGNKIYIIKKWEKILLCRLDKNNNLNVWIKILKKVWVINTNYKKKSTGQTEKKNKVKFLDKANSLIESLISTVVVFRSNVLFFHLI